VEVGNLGAIAAGRIGKVFTVFETLNSEIREELNEDRKYAGFSGRKFVRFTQLVVLKIR
jgi:hypothetical protein